MNSSVNCFKNQQSQAFIFNPQRLHRIHLRTIELLNQYFRTISLRSSSQQIKHNQKTQKPHFQQLRQRFFSFSSNNEQLIAKQIKQMKIAHKDVFRSDELKVVSQKLRRIKTTSSSLDKEIKLYQKQLVDELRDMNVQGNDWAEMKRNTQVKQEWRKRNLKQVQQYKSENLNKFFQRKITTDFETEKQRIISNIKKLQLQTNRQRSSKSQNGNKLRIFPISEQGDQSQAPENKSMNKFMERGWNSPKARTSSQQSDQLNPRRMKLFQKCNKNKERLKTGQEPNIGGFSKFEFQYQSLGNLIAEQKGPKPAKIRKSSDNLQIDRLKMDLKVQRKQSDNTRQNIPTDFGGQFPSGYQKSPFKSSFQRLKAKELRNQFQKKKNSFQQQKPIRKLVL